MPTRLVRSELWSGLQASGGSFLTDIRWKSASPKWRLDGEDLLTGTIPVVSRAGQLVSDFAGITNHREDGTPNGSAFDEWVVTEVRRSTHSPVVEIQATSPMALLTGMPVVQERHLGTFASVWAATKSLSRLWDDDLVYSMPAWLTKGTFEDEDTTISLSLSDASPRQAILNAVASLSAVNGKSYLPRLRRVSAAAWELDIVTELSSAVVNLFYGKGVTEVKEISRRTVKPTIVVPVGQAGTHMADAYHRVASKATATLTIEGWDGVGAPIGADDQFNGMYAKAHDGSLVQITDTVAPNTLVMASGTAFTAGDKIQFPFDASGHPIVALNDPSRTIDWVVPRTYPTPARTNFLRNGPFNVWTSGGSVLSHWTVGTTGTVSYGQDSTSDAWEYGGSSMAWNMSAVGTASLTLTQSVVLPERLRTSKWYLQVRVRSNGTGACDCTVTMTSASVNSASANIDNRTGPDDWAIIEVQADDTGDYVAPITIDISIVVSKSGGSPAKTGYLDMALICLDDGNKDPVFGSGPGRLFPAGWTDLLAGRTPKRYEVTLADRARMAYGEYAHETQIIGSTGRLVVPGHAAAGWDLDTGIQVTEISQDDMQPSKTTLQLAENSGRLSNRSLPQVGSPSVPTPKAQTSPLAQLAQAAFGSGDAQGSPSMEAITRFLLLLRSLQG